MFSKTHKILTSEKVKELVDVRNVGLYIFAIIVLAISWSGVKTVQTNYNLQKKISQLQQQNSVLRLQNQNADLQNKYLNTNEYLDISARQNLGLAAQGEKELLVPANVASKYVDPSLVTKVAAAEGSSSGSQSKASKNIEAWRDFLLGRKTTQ